jgi:hypothetical protein
MHHTWAHGGCEDQEDRPGGDLETATNAQPVQQGWGLPCPHSLTRRMISPQICRASSRLHSADQTLSPTCLSDTGVGSVFLWASCIHYFVQMLQMGHKCLAWVSTEPQRPSGHLLSAACPEPLLPRAALGGECFLAVVVHLSPEPSWLGKCVQSCGPAFEQKPTAIHRIHRAQVFFWNVDSD